MCNKQQFWMARVGYVLGVPLLSIRFALTRIRKNVRHLLPLMEKICIKCAGAFGLSNAPAYFMHAMQTLFQHSINRYCQVYLDDIIIFSPNAHQHSVQLRDTLNVLRRAGLKLNQAKCSFAQLKVKYLGHWFSGTVMGWIQKLLKR